MAGIFQGSDLGFIDYGALKLLYGTAFQEPAPVQLYGGWQGRNANPQLEPETVENYELNTLLQAGPVRLDLSGYFAQYRDVITETAKNTGRRRVFGAEATLELNVPSPLADQRQLRGFANYTYTQSRSSRRWNFEESKWVEVDGQWPLLGDIAPHKINFGVSVPAFDLLNVSVHGNWVASRKLYLANALRNPNRPDNGRELDGYFKLDGYVSADLGPTRLGLKVNNMLDTDYMHPGAEGASAGDSFEDTRAGGFQNSLVPTPGRSYFATLKLDL
jgi:iron complex outermembrane receptor protein